MVDVHYISDKRCYSFESDNEENINGYELSDLSDNFDDDSIDLDKAVPNQLQSLALEDIPYDRDVKYINIPSSSRHKSLLRNIPNRLFQQVITITEGNVEDIEKLNKHYAALDQNKKEYDRRSLYVDKKDDDFRGGKVKKKRIRKPKSDKEPIPESDPSLVRKGIDNEHEHASYQRGGLQRSNNRDLKKPTQNYEESQHSSRVKQSGRLKSEGIVSDTLTSAGIPSRPHSILNQQKSVQEHSLHELDEDDELSQSQDYLKSHEDPQHYDIDHNYDVSDYISNDLKPGGNRVNNFIGLERERDRNNARVQYRQDKQHSSLQTLPSDSQFYSQSPDVGDSGRRYPPRSDVADYNVSASKQQHRVNYKSSHDQALSLHNPQFAKQHVTPPNSNSFNANRQRHDGKKLHGRHGQPLIESSELQGNYHNNEVVETVLPLGFDPTGYGYSAPPSPYYGMDARAGRHFPHHHDAVAAEAEVLMPQHKHSYLQLPNGPEHRPNRSFRGAPSVPFAPSVAKQQQQQQPLHPPNAVPSAAARFPSTQQEIAGARELPHFQGSNPSSSHPNESKLNPAAAEWVPKFQTR